MLLLQQTQCCKTNQADHDADFKNRLKVSVHGHLSSVTAYHTKTYGCTQEHPGIACQRNHASNRTGIHQRHFSHDVTVVWRSQASHANSYQGEHGNQAKSRQLSEGIRKNNKPRHDTT